MLDQKLIERARNLIHAEWPERRAGLNREFSRIANQMNAAGRLRSGNTLRMLLEAAANELKAHANLVLGTLLRVHRLLGVTIYPDLANDLKQEAAIHVNEVTLSLTNELRDFALRFFPDLTKQMQIADAQANAKAKVNAEIDLYVDSLAAQSSTASASAGQTVVNISGTVGAVQTAPGAFASITQHIGAEDKGALLEVLDRLTSDLEQAADVGTDIKSELQELIPETAAELRKERPSLIKMKSLLQGIATTIQTLGSAQPAYQALKAALVPLGITLP